MVLAVNKVRIFSDASARELMFLRFCAQEDWRWRVTSSTLSKGWRSTKKTIYNTFWWDWLGRQLEVDCDFQWSMTFHAILCYSTIFHDIPCMTHPLSHRTPWHDHSGVLCARARKNTIFHDIPRDSIVFRSCSHMFQERP